MRAQQLLDCLSVFCAIFKMEVNLHESKTCVMVYRRPNMKIPHGVELRYRGHLVPFKDWYKYLRVVLHAKKELLGAADALAASGSVESNASHPRQMPAAKYHVV